MTDKKTVWGYASSPDPEGGWTGAFSTKEDAITAATDEGMDEVWVQEGEYPDAEGFVDSEDVMQTIYEKLAGEVYIPDSVDDAVFASDEAIDELQKLLEGWAVKHLQFNVWHPLGAPEHAVTVED